jgi:hypothetical protein
VGWGWVHLVLRSLFGLLYQPQMIDDGDCGATGAMRIGSGNRNTRRKLSQCHFLHNSHINWPELEPGPQEDSPPELRHGLWITKDIDRSGQVDSRVDSCSEGPRLISRLVDLLCWLMSIVPFLQNNERLVTRISTCPIPSTSFEVYITILIFYAARTSLMTATLNALHVKYREACERERFLPI